MKADRKVYDGSLHVPFTALVVGPSGSGKSTFVARLIKQQNSLLSDSFHYMYIFLGTGRDQNQVFVELQDLAEGTGQHVQLESESLSAEDKIPHRIVIFDVRSIYFKDGITSLKDTTFASDVETIIKKHHAEGLTGCLVFDDLMSELTDCNLLVPLFTKFSSHYEVSVIYTTQNLFHKGARASDHITIFRNTKLLTLFDSPMDYTVFSYVAQKLHGGGGSSSALADMFKAVAQDNRYIVIFGGFNVPSRLRFRTNIFAKLPFSHQKIIMPVKSSTSSRKAVRDGRIRKRTRA